MKRFCLIFLVLILGFCMYPDKIYACGSESTHLDSSQNNQAESNKEEKDCCAERNEECNNQEKDCNGNCNSKACHGTSIFLSFFISSSNEVSISKIPTLESLNFFYLENNFPSTFFSIWSPPNIA